MPAPVAAETRVDRDDPIVLDAEHRRLRQQVDLVQHDHLWQLVEARAVRLELVLDRGPALGRLAVGGVDHVDEHARPLQMREELVSEPRALARALDQARDVGDGQLPAVRRVDGAEDRRDRRERVLRDLRLRVRDPPQERRLARVREADERRIREQLQPQLEVALLAGQPDLGEPRRLTRRGCEATIASTSRPAPNEHDAGTRAREVGHEPGRSRRSASRRARAARRSLPRRRACPSLRLARRAWPRSSGAAESPTGPGGPRRRSPRRHHPGRRRRRRARPSGRASPAGS